MRFMMLMIPKGYESAAPGAMPNDASSFLRIFTRSLAGNCVGVPPPKKTLFSARFATPELESTSELNSISRMSTSA